MTDFNRTPQAQEVFKEKGKPKGPIKFKLQLNDEQKLDIITNLPTTWNNRSNYADRVKKSAKYINLKQKN